RSFHPRVCDLTLAVIPLGGSTARSLLPWFNTEAMAIRNFVSRPERGLRSAAGSDLPNLVVVAGPNGAGKSTLLHQLWRRRAEITEPGTTVTYVGPHRPWRKTQLDAVALYELSDSYREMTGMETLPS